MKLIEIGTASALTRGQVYTGREFDWIIDPYGRLMFYYYGPCATGC